MPFAVLAVLLVLTDASGFVEQDGGPAEAALAMDDEASVCGVDSLYILSRLEGRRASLATIQAMLGRSGPQGHSLVSLREGAFLLGLSLRGARIGLEDWPLDRPALVHFKGQPRGHFAVIRPVGHTGKLVQVIDGADHVEVEDFDHLVKLPTWDGLALVPLRAGDVLKQVAPWLIVSMIFSMLAAAAIVQIGSKALVVRREPVSILGRLNYRLADVSHIELTPIAEFRGP